MATISLAAMRHVGNMHGGNQVMRVLSDLKEASTQVFKKGELLQRNSSGAIVRFASIVGAGNDKLDASVASAGADLKALGIAMKDATNVSSGHIVIPVALFTPGTLVEGNLVDGSDGDAPTGYVLLATDIGRKVAMVFDDTTDRWYFTVNAGEGVATVYTFPGKAGIDTALGGVGDTNARVICAIDQEIMKFAALATVA